MYDQDWPGDGVDQGFVPPISVVEDYEWFMTDQFSFEVFDLTQGVLEFQRLEKPQFLVTYLKIQC